MVPSCIVSILGWPISGGRGGSAGALCETGGGITAQWDGAERRRAEKKGLGVLGTASSLAVGQGKGSRGWDMPKLFRRGGRARMIWGRTRRHLARQDRLRHQKDGGGKDLIFRVWHRRAQVL